MIKFDTLNKPFDFIDQFIQKRANPFRELTPDQKKKQKDEENIVKEEVKTLARICADIMNDQRYKEFADLFRGIEQRLLLLMKYNDESDRDKFFLKQKELQFKLRIFEQILNTPKGFVARGQEIEKKERIERTFVK